MADFVNVARGPSNANQIVAAIQQLRAGLGTLKELNGLRAQAIGESQAKMQAVFNVSTAAEAQILSDRWSALIAAADGGTITVLTDFVDAFNVSN